MHRIRVDRAHRLIDVALSGTMTVAEVDAYMADLRAVMFGHSLASNFVMLIDVSACTIQTQEATRSLGAHMAAMPKSRALAVVTASQLARLQVRRLFTQPYARVVATQREARAWVLEGREPEADLPRAS